MVEPEQDMDPIKYIQRAVVFNSLDDNLQSIAALRDLQKVLINIDRMKLDLKIIFSLCDFINCEVCKWKSFTPFKEEWPTINSLSFVSTALYCLRNSFQNCPRNQLMVVCTSDLIVPVIKCTEWTFNLEKYIQEHQATTEKANQDWVMAHSVLASACVTCLGNMVAANSAARLSLWPYLKPFIRNLLNYPKPIVSQMTCMVFHNFLLEEELRKQIIRLPDIACIVAQLSNLYLHESKYACFVLLAQETLLASEGVIEEVWPSLSDEQPLLCLDVISNMLENSAKHSINISSINYFTDMFKKEADKILCCDMQRLDEQVAKVLARLLNCVCLSSATDAFRLTLQADRSLLISSVYLLKCLEELHKNGTNFFTHPSDVVDHPAHGFKCDLVRLIANLVYRNKLNQNQVRELDGIPLILGCSKYDPHNPLIKEATVFAIRNLLEGNEGNQKAVRELQVCGVAENVGLANLGMEAQLEDGKLRIIQKQE